MGLIQVMENLTDPARLGAGIAVAFVATIYGVGLANLVFSAAGTRVVEFFHRAYVNPCFGRLAVIKGLDYRPLVAAGAEALRCEPRGNRLDLHADLPAILAALRKN
jgi:capsular polysaccharide biosynthesis protein